MNVERFREDLSNIAALSEAVDMRDRVLLGSRRLARRRAILVSTVAAVAVFGVAGITFAFVPRGGTVIPSTSETPSAPPASVSPSAPAGSGSPTHSAPPSTSFPAAKLKIGTWSTSDKASLPGTLYYLTGGGSGSAVPIRFNVLGGGKLRTAALQGTIGEYDCVRQSIVFSPDGASVAWVEGDNQQLQGGKLVVAALTGGTPRVVYNGPVQCDGGAGPKWMPDSRRLVVKAGGAVKLVDVTTGATTAAPSAWGGYLAWSANGSYVAYGEPGKIVVARPDGSVVRRVAYDINCCTGGFSVQGIANDGRYVAAGSENSDPSTVRSALHIVDTTTGQNVDNIETPSGGSISYMLAGDLRVVAVRSPAGVDQMSVALHNARGVELTTIPLTPDAQLRLYRP